MASVDRFADFQINWNSNSTQNSNYVTLCAWFFFCSGFMKGVKFQNTIRIKCPILYDMFQLKYIILKICCNSMQVKCSTKKEMLNSLVEFNKFQDSNTLNECTQKKKEKKTPKINLAR